MLKATADKHIKQAIALQYKQSSQQQEQSNAPMVIAKGEANIAQEIIGLAKEYGILVHEDNELSQFLQQLDLGQEIPEGLFQVIAELIAFSYVLQGKFPEDWSNPLKKIDFTE